MGTSRLFRQKSRQLQYAADNVSMWLFAYFFIERKAHPPLVAGPEG
jgi:hypothetical protein